MSDDVATIQNKLVDFYLAELDALRLSQSLQKGQLEALSAPFFLNLHAAKAYFEAPIRVMFVGQETKGWFCRLPEILNDPKNHVPPLLARYERSLLGPPGHSHFLKTRCLLEKELTGGIPGSVIWNNLFKMDVFRGKGKSRSARNYSVALTTFSAKLFRYERELLQPDIIIFGCSATHDTVVKSLFEAPKRKTVLVHVPKELWHFKYDQIDCFRTLHPAVARFRKHQSVQKHYQKIIQEIKSGKHANAVRIVGAMASRPDD
ncbi:hypothetical protein [Rugamonas apoptosis]|uniref:Uracil DNA glycosylase superfamily protein n=1 Tax=Rugamonas apoptosis TaxID=2758570 RepID=A0A7W2FEX2_9BURK|nr:hypothetical protein [Rugamonas apoptosis]MBA5690413.1 hypothetical protein [Rugamonas apoptosis]